MKCPCRAVSCMNRCSLRTLGLHGKLLNIGRREEAFRHLEPYSCVRDCIAASGSVAAWWSRKPMRSIRSCNPACSVHGVCRIVESSATIGVASTNMVWLA